MRTRTRTLPVQQYNARVSEFNAKMKELLVRQGAGPRPAERCLHEGIWWWEHQKLKGNPPLEVGVHFMDKPGQKRLYRSICLALYEAE